MALTLPGSGNAGPTQGPTPPSYNWTLPYNQWTDPQKTMAEQYLQPRLASGDYQTIGNDAKSLGVNPFDLNNAVYNAAFNNAQSTGASDPVYGPAGMSGVGDLMAAYARSVGQASPNYSGNGTPFTGFQISPTQSANLKAFFGVNSSDVPNYMSPVNYLRSQGVNNRYGSYLVNKGNAQDITGSQTAANNFMNDRILSDFTNGRGLNMNMINRLTSNPAMARQWGGTGSPFMNNNPAAYVQSLMAQQPQQAQRPMSPGVMRRNNFQPLPQLVTQQTPTSPGLTTGEKYRINLLNPGS